MATKNTLLILASFVFLQSSPVAVLAGGEAFVGVGPGGVSAGVSAFSRHGRSRATIFVRVENRWVLARHGYHVAPLYGAVPNPEGQYGGTDRIGALYINGYRVQPSGWLRVQVEPRDAQVLLNGSAVPIDTASGISNSVGLLVGKHHVEVRKEGFETYQAELAVKQARDVLVQVHLER